MISGTAYGQAGNVGIGTLTPAPNSRLHVKVGSTSNFDNVMIESPVTNKGFGLQYMNPANQWQVGINIGNFTDGRLRIVNTDNAANSNVGITVMPNGRTGIGNFGGTGTNPLGQLQVLSSYLTGTTSFTDTVMGVISSPVNYVNGPAGVRGEYRGTFLNDGSGVVGLATAPGAGYGIGVTGSGHYNGVLGLGMSGGFAGVLAYGNGANYALYSYGDMYLNGNFTSSTFGSFASDRKLKKDIQPITGALNVINQMKPSSYEFRVGEYGTMNLPKGRHYGVIAQDLQQVMPQLVIPQKYMPPTREEKGFEYLSVNYGEMIPLLIKGIQEQQQIIEQLKARVAQLEKTQK